MLPIDEDILLTRYADDERGAHWYRAWRKLGADPGEAICAVDRLRADIDAALIGNNLTLLSPAQMEVLQAYAATCGTAIDVLCEMADIAPLRQDYVQAIIDEWAATAAPTQTTLDDVANLRRELASATKIDLDQIRKLVADAQRIAQLVREQLHS